MAEVRVVRLSSSKNLCSEVVQMVSRHIVHAYRLTSLMKYVMGSICWSVMIVAAQERSKTSAYFLVDQMKMMTVVDSEYFFQIVGRTTSFGDYLENKHQS